MRNIISFFILLSLSACSLNQQNRVQDKNILEIYESLPVELFNNEGFQFKYLLEKKNDGWVTQSSADYEMTVTVDVPNGYIEISDEGTGGGTNFHQVVLFRKADKTPCIGITLGGFNGIYFERSARFYEFKKQKWLDVTESVFPETKFEDFLNPKYLESSFKENAEIFSLLEMQVLLPRVGLTVEVRLNREKLKALIRENVNFNTGKVFNEEENDQLFNLTGNIAYDKILIRWDKKAGEFKMIEKVPMPLSQIEEEIFQVNQGELDAGILSEDEMILDKLWSLPEVLKLAAYIDSVSEHTRDLKLLIEEVPNDNEGWYRVKAAEDNGDSFVTHQIFFIHPHNLHIDVYDVLTDKRLSLDDWRKLQ